MSPFVVEAHKLAATTPQVSEHCSAGFNAEMTTFVRRQYEKWKR